jgi:hypothetical protein
MAAKKQPKQRPELLVGDADTALAEIRAARAAHAEAAQLLDERSTGLNLAEIRMAAVGCLADEPAAAGYANAIADAEARLADLPVRR